jgi:hypothetical protein
MIRPQRPSFPAPSEPNLRRLGVGGGNGNDRPLRAQLVVALVALLILVAVPLYLWRRPGPADSAPSASVGSGLPSVSASSLASAVIPDAGVAPERVRLGPPQRARCGPSPRSKAREGPLCDQLPYFEEALKKAIRENVDCAPRAKTEGTINFVLQVDFTRQKVHVFPGASGKWRGTQARRATQCVLRSLPVPPWTSLTHRENYYQLAILATYPEPSQASAMPAASGSAAPLFE